MLGSALNISALGERQTHPRAERIRKELDMRSERILVVSGHGQAIKVSNGQLVVGDEKIPRYKAKRDLRLIVVLDSASGWLSFDAVSWCEGTGVDLVIETSSGAMASTWLAKVDGAIHRAQVIADPLPISKYLLLRRLEGQIEIVRKLGENALEAQLRGFLHKMSHATDLKAMTGLEPVASRLYHQVIQGYIVPQWSNGGKGVPSHWSDQPGRRGINGVWNSRAATPGNAMLNYTYSMAGVAANICMRSVGLDPYVGWLHTDTKDTQAGVADLMDGIRSEMEALVIGYVSSRDFDKRDFLELPTGEIRMASEIRRDLIESGYAIALDAAAVVAEDVLAMVHEYITLKRRAPTTRLTYRKQRERFA